MNAIALPDASGLPDVVERARALLDEGDVIRARLLASVAYDEAKVAGRAAERLKAGEELVDKARRLQADALLIEARAKIRIADEWTAAQAAGQAATRGRRKNVDESNVFTAEEAGFSRQDIHEARKLAEAEKREPGIVERAIAARINAGLEASRASLRASIGTRTASAEDRGHNLYETPPEAMRVLLALERFSAAVLEPACGRGAIVRPLEDAGYDVLLSDLVDYGTATRHGELQAVVDFLDTPPATGNPDIVTNPPYGELLNAFVAHALRVHRPKKMALLLNLNFVCGTDDDDRNFALDSCPPARIHVFSRRLPMMHRDGWDGPKASSSMNTAWFVWERDEAGGYSGRREMTRVDWKDFSDVPPLAPMAADEKPVVPKQQATVGLVWEQKYPGGRMLARSGALEVGAILPGEENGGGWQWMLFCDRPSHGGGEWKKARNEAAARKAFDKAWMAFLAGANLYAVPA